MTIPPRRSAGWSARPGPTDDPATEYAGLYARTGPESITPSASHSPSVPERRGGRLSGSALSALAARLSPRDHSILTELDRFGFLTSHQFQALQFFDHRTKFAAARLCRRTLSRLADHRLIAPVERRRGGIHGGSSATVWRLDVAGDRLVRLARDAPRARFKLPSERFLDHRLTVADCYVQLVNLGRSASIDLLDATPEPDSWRRYLGPGGSRETLKPDLSAITAAGDYEDHWFLEIDRATESLPTVIKKCAQYERYRRTGIEQQQAGLFPLVVWVVPDARRARQVEHALQAARDLDASLFRVVETEQLTDLVQRGAA